MDTVRDQTFVPTPNQVRLTNVVPVDGVYNAYGFTQCTRLAYNSPDGPKKAVFNADTLMLLAIGMQRSNCPSKLQVSELISAQ